MTTLYEVIYQIWALAFPSSILSTYADLISLLTFVNTLILLYGVIIIPVWRLSTWFLRRSKR